MKYYLMNKNLLIGKFELGNVHKWLEHRQALYFRKRHSLGEARR